MENKDIDFTDVTHIEVDRISEVERVFNSNSEIQEQMAEFNAIAKACNASKGEYDLGRELVLITLALTVPELKEAILKDFYYAVNRGGAK